MREPGLYDIDGSAHWFNAPDHGIVVDRDPTDSRVKVAVKKCKFHGATGFPGDVYLNYKDWEGRYIECEPPSDYDNYE